MQAETVSVTSSEDGPERDLIEEINRRAQFPVTKQDSYSHAIYQGSKTKKNVRKQGSYEAAVESGIKKDIAMRKTKRILKYRKQDSYQRAIGGSFEDEHSVREEKKKEPGVTRVRKQESYLKAVGEVSPDTESRGFEDAEKLSIRKQDSYIEAMKMSRSPQEEDIQFRSIPEDQSGDKPKFSIGDDDLSSQRTAGVGGSSVSARLGVCVPPTTSIRMKKQDSYTMALEESSDEDYIDKEIKRKIALKRT